MKRRAIIFDLDGTIVTTEACWRHATQELLDFYAPGMDAQSRTQLLDAIHGLALHQSCRLIKERTQLELSLEDLMREKSHRAHALYAAHMKFIPGFVSFHKQLSTLHLKSGIATNADPETAQLSDQLMNLRRFFGPHIYHMGHVNYQNKPNPALYLFAAQQLGVEPHECVAIEDSAHGIAAAKSAGMYCIGINTAHKPTQLQLADCVVQHYRDIKLDELIK